VKLEQSGQQSLPMSCEMKGDQDLVKAWFDGDWDMNDNVSYAMDADYKVYELRTVIADLKGLADDPATRHIVKKYWDDIFKSCENLKDILNNLPPWEE
jgi:hypothetical protein